MTTTRQMTIAEHIDMVDSMIRCAGVHPDDMPDIVRALGTLRARVHEARTSIPMQLEDWGLDPTDDGVYEDMVEEFECVE